MEDLDLDDVLRDRLGAETYERYAKFRSYHFWLWKTHRICDDNSLRAQRFYLYHASILTPAPHKQLARRRPFHDYAATLGIHLDESARRKPFAGDRFPGVDLKRDVFEPGDGEKIYEEARLGWSTRGYGKALGYSLETTLISCLREPIRWAPRGTCKSYLHADFHATLESLEVWSVVNALGQLVPPDQKYDAPDPAEALLSAVDAHGVLNGNALQLARTYSRARLDQSESQNVDGELSLFMVMLGSLIAELLARIAAPNGMAFGYLGAAVQIEALLSKFGDVFVSQRMPKAEADNLRARLESLVAECRHFAGGSEKQKPSVGWTSQCRKTADQLRAFGFAGRASRTLDDDHADLVFSASNLLWRWTFFIDQRETIDDLYPSPSIRVRGAVCDMLWVWLQRPWGILTIADVARAFRGLAPGDENDEMPRAFSAVSPILKTSVVEYLGSRFGLRASQAERAVRQLIDSRYSLYLVRRLTTDIELATRHDEFTEAAHTLITVFSRWLFQERNSALSIIEQDLTEVPNMLRSGDWLSEILAVDKEASVISIAEQEIIAPYLLNPAAFLVATFLFEEDDFNVAHQVGLFPLEYFRFLSPPGVDGEPRNLGF